MLLGLVSNCWQLQLDDGASLPELISEAERRHIKTVELRQGCLGAFESADVCAPIAERLEILPRRFPTMTFNLALNVPILNVLSASHHAMLEAGRRAAVALAGDRPPHLRLVDLGTSFSFDQSQAIANLHELTTAMHGLGGILSVEHSLQNWNDFLAVFRTARSSSDACSQSLKLCFDPCNLNLLQPELDLVSITGTLAPHEISMLHLKQADNGTISPGLEHGDLDWSIILRAARDIGYDGPFLLETAPTSNIWQHTETNTEFVRRIYGLL